MDPMSAITAGLGALTSILKAVGAGADLLTSGAQFLTKIFDSLKGMINTPQADQAMQTIEKGTEGWPEGPRNQLLTASRNVVSGAGAPTTANV